MSTKEAREAYIKKQVEFTPRKSFFVNSTSSSSAFEA
jgi:hypothetical protein